VVERALGRAETHRFRIELPANHAALGVLMQNGIDVALMTSDPSGKKLGEFDSPNGDKGPEPFLIESTVAGGYDLEVKPFVEPTPGGAPAPETGRYELRLEAIVTADVFAERKAAERIASPRILEVWRHVRSGRRDAVEKFWADLKGKSPIVEPYPGEPKDVLVTFVMRSKEPYVALLGVMDFREKPMVRIGDSDLWYLTARLPADARFDYGFLALDVPADYRVPFRPERRPDPRWEKRQVDPNNGNLRFGFSRTELPSAPPQPWIEPKPDVPKGKITEVKLDSTRLKESRRIGIYTPAGHDPKKRYPLVIVFDGEAYGLAAAAQIPLPTILDNMIAAKKIPPVIAAFVANQGTRERDLPGSPAFSAFVAKELVPKLRADYRAGLTPRETIVTGSSFGGLCSVYTAFHHPDAIGNVLSQSGSFQFIQGSIGKDITPLAEGGFLMREIAAAPRRRLRFYLDAGLFEDRLLESNRHMRDVLAAKGYPLTYAEFSGGHDYWIWRHTISDGLVALLHAP
jgi:enterochelin esterase-like enzyme